MNGTYGDDVSWDGRNNSAIAAPPKRNERMTESIIVCSTRDTDGSSGESKNS